MADYRPSLECMLPLAEMEVRMSTLIPALGQSGWTGARVAYAAFVTTQKSTFFSNIQPENVSEKAELPRV